MKTKSITEAKDPDLRASGAALLRAAGLARDTAIRTDTNLVIVKNGQLTRISPQTLRAQGSTTSKKSA